MPFADVGPLKVPDGLTDEQVLFLSDIFPTGYMGAEMCDIKPRRRRSRSGARARSGSSRSPARCLLGAERVIAIDRFPYRLAHGARASRRDRDDQLRRGRRARRAEGDDRRARPGRLHRRRRAWRRTATAPVVRLRPREAGDEAGDRPAARAARGDPRLPQRRHRLGHRRLRRLHRQVPDGRGHEPRRSRSRRASATCSATCSRCSSASSAGEIDPSFVITHQLPLDDAPRATTCS